MEQNGLQGNLTKQLENLKKEQYKAEQIYIKRIKMGALRSDPESVQILAQTILDRKNKIEEIEAQITPREEDIQNDEAKKENNAQPKNQETSLTEYHRNPIINWLQRMINKVGEISNRLEQFIETRKNGRPTEPKIYETKWEEYQNIIDTDFSTQGNGKKEKGEKGNNKNENHKIFVNEISGNGQYNTYGNNAQKINEFIVRETQEQPTRNTEEQKEEGER